MEIVAAIIAFIFALIAWNRYQRTRQRQRLFNKYHDDGVVDRIMQKMIWQGMSDEQLIDSWGRPAAKDQKIYKTKISETFKYNRVGKNRYGSRVQLENGIVVGWSQK